MSGGSLDYLCFKYDISTEDLWKIQRAIETLEESGLRERFDVKETKAYKDLKDLELHLSKVKEKFQGMSDLLHDIEWKDSGDYGDEQLIESLEKYNVEK